MLFDFLETIYTFQQIELGLFHVTWQEIYLLYKIIQSDGLTVGETAELLRTPLFQASRLVKQLHEKGLVEKVRQSSNRRIVVVTVTPQGRRILEEVETYQYSLISQNIHILSPAEYNSILDGLGKLKLLLSIERG